MEMCVVGLLQSTMMSSEMLQYVGVTALPKPHWVIVMTSQRPSSRHVDSVKDHFRTASHRVSNTDVTDNSGTKHRFVLIMPRTSLLSPALDVRYHKNVQDLVLDHLRH